MKTLTSVAFGAVALAVASIGFAEPAAARGNVGIYVSPFAIGINVQEGRAICRDDWYRRALGATRDGFEVAATVPMVFGEVEAAADTLRPMYALYFGGMGAKGANFHANVPIRMGYEGVVSEVQDLYLEGRKDEAAAKIPTELIEKLALIGPADKIRHDLEAWRDSIATTLLVGGDAAMVRTAAELVLG